MSNNELKIDERTHSRVLSATERLKHALFALFLGFILINIIGFWMFPGPGIFGLYMFSSAHHTVAFISDIVNIAVIALLAICFIYGWFRGQYFIDRLKTYLSYWKFW
ncbi:hypothetical protein LX73_0197 [Fodinibius salinus]|uniref:Uncharacterized protein n=2 Tax=Fodinibius salinus TaxID=860790 RepID=A0A5D3YLT0_9BACT|nr:hypothetical protein LX73_0197 [Fodinibius salinus]